MTLNERQLVIDTIKHLLTRLDDYADMIPPHGGEHVADSQRHRNTQALGNNALKTLEDSNE